MRSVEESYNGKSDYDLEEELLELDLESNNHETTTLSAALLSNSNSISLVQHVLSVDEGMALDSLPSDSALLISASGISLGSRFLLDTDLLTAGRHPSSDIFLDDVTVSRHHSEFFRKNGKFFVRDAGSLNGTYVNGSRSEEHALETGVEVQIGKFRLVFYQKIS